MDNEVVIKVTANDDTSSGFDSARNASRKFEADFGKIGISAGAEAGKGLAGSITKSIGALSGSLTPVLAGSAAAAAPLIGASISGAILGAAGAGGIVGAFMVAKNDARVVAATEAMGDRIEGRLKKAAVPFIGVTLDGIDRIESALDTIDFEQIFGDAAKNAPVLLEGVASAIEDIGDGFEKLSASAGPSIAAIADGVANIGEEIGSGLESLADNGEEGAEALRVLFSTVEIGVESTFNLINVLTELYGILADTTVFDELITWYAGLGDESDETTGQQKKLMSASEGVTQSFQGQTSALEELMEKNQEYLDPAFALLDAQEDLTGAQKDYNEAIDEHGKKSPEAQSALRKLAKAAGDVGAAAGAAGVSFTGKMTPAMEKMYREAGLSEDQIAALKRQLQQAKGAANDWEGTFRQDYIVRTQYLTGGERRSGDPQQMAHGGITGAATGGIHNGLRWVGEQGPELVNLPAGATVHSAADSQRMMRGGGGGQGGGAGGPITVQVMLDGRVLAEGMVEPLREQIRAMGAGSAQSYLGQPGVA